MSHIQRLVLRLTSIQKISNHQSIRSLLAHLNNLAITLVFHKISRNKFHQINKYMWGDNRINLASLNKRNKLILQSIWVIIKLMTTYIISKSRMLESTNSQQEAGQVSSIIYPQGHKVVLMNAQDLNWLLMFLHSKMFTQGALELMILIRMKNYKKLS